MPTAILVEDEPLLRAELREQLAMLWPELGIVGEADNGVQAIQLIESHSPDIVFLDVQVPGLNGLEVARHIGETAQVVFVTAYDQHALAAFDNGAVDYLVKPVTASRIALTIKRLKSRSASRPTATVWQQLSPVPAPERLKWIKASVGETVRLVLVDEVLCFQSDGKYTNVVMANMQALIRTPLKTLVEQLDPSRFAQIHRSTIINLHALDRVERVDSGQQAWLRGLARPLPISESFARQFRQM
jgi:DNA-binding LytR/AlgR family response regulator